MAGGGVRLENVRELVLVSGVRELHTSLRQQNGDRHVQMNGTFVYMQSEPPSRSSLLGESVRAVRRILDEIEILPVL
jgi:copper homeostasis protein CutC